MGVLKKTISFIFLLSFIAQIFGSTIVLAKYYSNKAPFIKNCINKNKPQLKCNGKCQMMKKMAEEEQKEKDDLEKKSGLKISVLSTKSFFNNKVADAIAINSNLSYHQFQVQSTTDRSFSVFHPPSLV